MTVDRHSRWVRSLLIGAAIAVGIYLLTDGKFLFLPLVFLPALPILRGRRRGSTARGAPPGNDQGPGGPIAPLPEPPPPRSDPRWN